MENINLDKIIKVDELDYNLILNVSEEIGEKIQRLIQGQATQEEKENTSIEIIENPSNSMDLDESRKMIFKINGENHPLTIVDFPCIIEANKTIDSKTFYKSSDIAQMMYVHDDTIPKEDDLSNFNPFRTNDEMFNKMIWKKDLDHKYKLKHGLGKCTRNIRTRRFKRKLKHNHEEILEVAKKLKSIIDNGAANFENQNKTNTEYEEDRRSIISKGKQSRQGNNKNDQAQVMMMIENKQANSNPNPNSAVKNTSNKKEKKEKKEKNSLSISLPLAHTNEGGKPNIINLNMGTEAQVGVENDNPLFSNEKVELLNKYNNIKESYNAIKKELDGMEEKPSDKVKLKKSLKKQLKAIKAIYKETL